MDDISGLSGMCVSKLKLITILCPNYQDDGIIMDKAHWILALQFMT